MFFSPQSAFLFFSILFNEVLDFDVTNAANL